MKKLVTHKDGSLRAGRIAAGLFLLILGGCSLAFWLRQPVDQILVKVEHVFEPKDTAEDRQPNEPEKPVKSEKTKQPEQTKKPAKTKAVEAGKKAPVSPGESEKTARAESISPKQPAARSPGKSSKGTRKTEGNPQKTLEPEPGKKAESSPGKKPEKQAADSGQEPAEDDVQKTAGPETDRQNKPVFSVEDKSEAEKAVQDLRVKLPPGMRETKKNKNESRSAPKQKTEATGNRAITVDSRQYMGLMRSWQKSGSGKAEPQVYPLKVENLENTYELLQMKPVAEAGNKIYDLSDGSRLNRQALASYTTTVFQVEDVWDKWGRALEEVGLDRTDNLRVRYYMYDFIRRAIYQRADRAVAWCREKGLLDQGLKPSDIDVRGRTYAINQKGGGRFGVFVPLALVTPGGVVPVDPACFSGEADVAALQAAGLL